MTEKRFKLGYVCGDYGLIDNDDVENKWTDFCSMSENSEKNVQICIRKMNELADENEQLKKENKMLRTNVEKLTGDVKYLQTLPSKHRELYKQSEAKRVNLLEENLQLKQENIELIKYGKELLEYINTPPKHRKSIFDAVVYFKKKNEETINVNIDSEIPFCKNCKHLGLDGMFGLICDANGNNKNHDCPKYEKESGGGMTKKKRFTVQSSYLGMYSIFDEKQGKPLTDIEVIELLEKGDVE